jgi:hypothetical protein
MRLNATAGKYTMMEGVFVNWIWGMLKLYHINSYVVQISHVIV